MFVRTVVVFLVCFALVTFAQDADAVPKRKSVREFGTATEKISNAFGNAPIGAVPSADTGIKSLLNKPPRGPRSREGGDGPRPRGPKPRPDMAGPDGFPAPRGPKPAPADAPDAAAVAPARTNKFPSSDAIPPASAFAPKGEQQKVPPGGSRGRHVGGHSGRGGEGRKGLRGGRGEGRRPRGDFHDEEAHDEAPAAPMKAQQQQPEAEDNHEDEIVVEVRMKKIPQGDNNDRDGQQEGPSMEALKQGMLGKRGAGRAGGRERGEGGRGGGGRHHRGEGGRGGGRGGGGKRAKGGEHSDD